MTGAKLPGARWPRFARGRDPEHPDVPLVSSFDDVASDTLRILSTWLPPIWLLLLPVPLLRFPLRLALLEVLLQLLDTALFLLIGFWHRRGKIPSHRAHVVLAGALAVLTLDLVVRGLVSYAPDRLLSMCFLIIGIGLFCLSLRWMVPLLLFAVGCSAVLIWRTPPEHGGMNETVLPLLIAASLAVAARAARASAIRHIDRLRREEARHLRDARANEAQFRGMIERIHDVFYRTNMAGVIELVSPSCRRFGYLPGDLIGKHVSVIYAAEEERRAFAKLLRERGYLVDYELNLVRRDGALVTAAASANILLDETGEPCGFEGLLHDISDRKREETRQKELAFEALTLARVGQELIAARGASTMLNRLCELTAEIFRCDASHTVLLESREAALIANHGESREQAESLAALRIPAELLEPLLSELESKGLAQAATDQVGQLAVTPLAQKYGVTRALCYPLRSSEGIVGFQTAVFRGRNEAFTPTQERLARGFAQLASLALANVRLLEELEAANRLKSDFVATMSHELRTPLSVIIGYNMLLQEGTFGALTKEQSEALLRIDRSTRELLDLITATLDLSRLEGRQVPLELSQVEISSLLDEIEAEGGSLWQKPGLTIERETPANLPALHTDRLKLKVVLKNLIGNAVKFTPNGRITVAAEARQNGMSIAVADTGIGISPEVLPTIFEPFRQGDSSVTRSYGGVGLGLYIVARLLDMLGGKIDVASEVGRGSTFSVLIPQAAPANRRQ